MTITSFSDRANQPGIPINRDTPISSEAKISGYSMYGTFSGADIKVIVHLPMIQNKKNELQKDIEKLESEQEETRRRIDELTQSSGTKVNSSEVPKLQQELSDLQNGISYNNQQIASMQSDLASVSQLPTTQTLAELSSISWSIFREKSPVRPLGSVYPRSYCRGPRTISGTMVFTIFHEHAFHELMQYNLQYYSTGRSDIDSYSYTSNLPDQLPPLDITILFANEYGALSTMGLYGVEFFQEGGTFSIEDIYSENVIHYVARDLDPMATVENAKIDTKGIAHSDTQPLWQQSATSLLRERTNSSAIKRTASRRNPFI